MRPFPQCRESNGKKSEVKCEVRQLSLEEIQAATPAARSDLMSLAVVGRKFHE